MVVQSFKVGPGEKGPAIFPSVWVCQTVKALSHVLVA